MDAGDFNLYDYALRIGGAIITLFGLAYSLIKIMIRYFLRDVEDRVNIGVNKAHHDSLEQVRMVREKADRHIARLEQHLSEEYPEVLQKLNDLDEKYQLILQKQEELEKLLKELMEKMG